MLDSGYRVVASLANGASVLDQIDLLNPDILSEEHSQRLMAALFGGISAKI
jgi:hypothetical protein